MAIGEGQNRSIGRNHLFFMSKSILFSSHHILGADSPIPAFPMKDWFWIGDQGIGWRPTHVTPDTFLPLAQAAIRYFEEQPPLGIRELVPGFQSLVFLLDDRAPLSMNWIENLSIWLNQVPPIPQDVVSKPIEIPVQYNGPDLMEVAQYTGLTVQEVIQLHCQPIYRVHFIGFLPGFPYLGGLDSRLSCPRKKAPRRLVLAGTVGIGGAQTGIYPQDSPGGWQWIGQTRVSLFSKQTGPLLKLGDSVQFIPL